MDERIPYSFSLASVKEQLEVQPDQLLENNAADLMEAKQEQSMDIVHFQAMLASVLAASLNHHHQQCQHQQQLYQHQQGQCVEGQFDLGQCGGASPQQALPFQLNLPTLAPYLQALQQGADLNSLLTSTPSTSDPTSGRRGCGRKRSHNGSLMDDSRRGHGGGEVSMRSLCAYHTTPHAQWSTHPYPPAHVVARARPKSFKCIHAPSPHTMRHRPAVTAPFPTSRAGVTWTAA
jgi:hypothetical protein